MLKRTDIRRIFERNRGAQAELVRRLENDGTGRTMRSSTITLWMQGHTKSRRIHEAANAYAAELLASERDKGGAAA